MGEPARIVPIVEGFSEVESVPILIRRVVSWHSIAGVEVGQPVRVNRKKVIKPGELERAMELARRRAGARAIVLVLDADNDCPKNFAPTLLDRLTATAPGLLTGVVLPKTETEAWLIGGIESLRGKRQIRNDVVAPPDPESVHDAKGWLTTHKERLATYVPTDDQASLIAQVDLNIARSKFPSLDKFIRDIVRIAEAIGQPGG